MTNLNNLTAILVDDEPNAIENLTILLKEYCNNITIVSTANCVDDAVVEIEKHNPDVIFLDIEMPQKTGFELFKETEKKFQTIFVTAYDEYAIKAFDVSAVDYLLKPINITRLKKAVDKLSSNPNNTTNIATLEENIKNQEITKITIANNHNYDIIKVNNIICIEAKGAYSIINFVSNKHLVNHISSKPLRYFDDLLNNNKKFFRTHRSWLVNTDSIISFDKKSAIITTEHNFKIPVTKKKIKDFLPYLTR